MAKKLRCFCYSCESEFSVTSDLTDPIEFCPYCGSGMEDGDHSDEDTED